MSAGPAGPKGDRGKTGARLPRGIARAVVFLFAFSLLLGTANLLFTARYVHGQQAAQRQAGEAVERKLCTTFGSLAALKPPPGNPHTNPSRAYLQAEHATLVQLGADLGCGGTR